MEAQAAGELGERQARVALDVGALLRAEGLEVFRAAGTSEAWNAPRAPMHIMGGTVMGTSAADSVTNSYGQTHDLPNLFVGGAGLFPTSGGVNPTFTVHALAARSSEYLVKNWDSVIG